MKNKWLAVLVVIVLVVLAGWWFVKEVRERLPVTEDQNVAYPDLGQEHIPVGAEHPPYNSNPPSSGWHYAETAKLGFYDVDESTPADENLIHNLEHGEIWVAYRPPLRPVIEAELKKVNHQDVSSVDRASHVIQDLIHDAVMPKIMAEAIVKEYKKLKTKWVAVRSSATAEDSSIASWAGELDTFLFIDEKKLVETVKKCWASLFTPRAIFYRFEKKLHKTPVSVAVVIQQMVDSEISGVAFSVHPVT